MGKTENDLSAEEVNRLVYSYDDASVTDELCSFGTLLLQEVRNRSANIDSKAATMLGWSTGLLVFLFTQLDEKSTGLIALAFGVVVASAACLRQFMPFWLYGYAPNGNGRAIKTGLRNQVFVLLTS